MNITTTYDEAMVKAMIAEAVAKEREQIAQMIEGVPSLIEFAQNDKGGCAICGFAPRLAAETIRARNKFYKTCPPCNEDCNQGKTCPARSNHA